MPLVAGTRLGVFEILAPLGKGGMGEVYLNPVLLLGFEKRKCSSNVVPKRVRAIRPLRCSGEWASDQF